MTFEPMTRRGVHLRLAMEATSASRGRKAMRGEVAGWAPDFTVEWLDTLELLTSDLITDALLQSDLHQMDVTAYQDRGGVRVTVSDGGRRGAVPSAEEHPDDLSSRGLLLVDALADQWGITSHPNGRTVWFRQNAPRAQTPKSSL